MQRIDLKKEYKHFYLPSAKKIEFVDVPEFNFIMMTGVIGTEESVKDSQEFQDAMSALCSVSYTLKFISKQRSENPIDYTVMALEGLWWTESGGFDINKKERWYFDLMMLQPDHITVQMFEEATEKVRQKGNSPKANELRFENFHEGPSVQIMHIGPYSAEPATIRKMMVYVEEKGYSLRGKHHEIYLGDPRRAKPEKLRTVLRHPVSL